MKLLLPSQTVRLCLSIAIGLCVCTAGHCSDWPQFRGPGSTATAADAKPPLKWSEKEGITWKLELPGPGSSSPIVFGERVFITYYTGYGTDAAKGGAPDKLQRHLACIDRKTGKVRWAADVATVVPESGYKGYIREHGYASSTPVTDGEAVYVFFGKSGVLAFDFDGKKLWQASVGTKSDVRGWGSAASPVLVGNLVIVNASSESRAVVALDKKTGKQVWKAEGSGLSLAFGTPALVKASADRTDLVVAMPGEVWGLEPATGKSRWKTTIKPSGNICPAVIAGDGVAFITGGYETKASVALKVGGDASKANILWSINQSSYVPTPVLHNGNLYCVDDYGIAWCVNADKGTQVYKERLTIRGVQSGLSRPFYASAVVADGRLYAVSRRDGVFVLKVGDTFEQLTQNPPLDDSDFNATPALAGTQLFLRSNRFLYCIEAK